MTRRFFVKALTAAVVAVGLSLPMGGNEKPKGKKEEENWCDVIIWQGNFTVQAPKTVGFITGITY